MDKYHLFITIKKITLKDTIFVFRTSLMVMDIASANTIIQVQAS